MATQDQSVSKENLDQISTGTFAVDVANYRSILLRFEKEVAEAGFDSKRASFILNEVTGMQEVVAARMRRAGNDARKLGVPPEDIEQTVQIYRRTLAVAAVQFVRRYEYIFGEAASTFLDAAKLAGDAAPVATRALAGDVASARVMIDQILRAPDTASTIFPILAKSIPRIEAAWKATGWSTDMPPERMTAPPLPPTPPSPGGAGDFGDMSRRVERLETKVDKLTDDVGKINTKLGGIDERLKHLPTKADLNGSFLKLYVALFGALITATIGLAWLMAKGFKWF